MSFPAHAAFSASESERMLYVLPGGPATLRMFFRIEAGFVEWASAAASAQTAYASTIETSLGLCSAFPLAFHTRSKAWYDLVVVSTVGVSACAPSIACFGMSFGTVGKASSEGTSSLAGSYLPVRSSAWTRRE